MTAMYMPALLISNIIIMYINYYVYKLLCISSAVLTVMLYMIVVDDNYTYRFPWKQN